MTGARSTPTAWPAARGPREKSTATRGPHGKKAAAQGAEPPSPPARRDIRHRIVVSSRNSRPRMGVGLRRWVAQWASAADSRADARRPRAGNRRHDFCGTSGTISWTARDAPGRAVPSPASSSSLENPGSVGGASMAARHAGSHRTAAASRPRRIRPGSRSASALTAPSSNAPGAEEVRRTGRAPGPVISSPSLSPVRGRRPRRAVPATASTGQSASRASRKARQIHGEAAPQNTPPPPGCPIFSVTPSRGMDQAVVCPVCAAQEHHPPRAANCRASDTNPGDGDSPFSEVGSDGGKIRQAPSARPAATSGWSAIPPRSRLDPYDALR